MAPRTFETPHKLNGNDKAAADCKNSSCSLAQNSGDGPAKERHYDGGGGGGDGVSVGSSRGSRGVDGERPGCMQWLALKIKLVEKDATPPNWKYISLVFAALFSSSCTLTYLFPFLPEMILFLGYSETEKGVYAGMIAAGVFAGRAVGSMFWGWLADRKGRKIVLQITLVLNGVFAGLFGFAGNIYMAIVFRFMCGLVNGTVGTGKAILYDISDNTNQAIGMTMMSMAWGSGLIAGPLVGGLLASPVQKWPETFSADGFFGQFPFILSSGFPFIVSILTFFIITFFFDETITPTRKRTDTNVDVEAVSEKASSNAVQIKVTHPSETGGLSPLLNSTTSVDGGSHHHLRQRHRGSSQLAGSVISLSPDAEMSMSLVKDAIGSNQNSGEVPDSIKDDNDALFLAKSEPMLNRLGGMQTATIAHASEEKGQPFHPHLLPTYGNAQNSSLPSSHHLLADEDKPYSVSEHHVGDLNVDQEADSPLLTSTESSHLPTEIKQRQTYQRSTSHDPKTMPDLAIRSLNGNGKMASVSPQESQDGDVCNLRENGNTRVVSIHQSSVVSKGGEEEEEEREEERQCTCADRLCQLSCCVCTNSGLHKLLRLSDVWATIMLYSALSFVTIAIDDVFPVFASTDPSYGGLGFTSGQIGVALGGMTLPILFVQIKLYPSLVTWLGIRKTCMFCLMICLICAQCIPLTRLLTYSKTALWVVLMVIQIPFKITTNSCFASTSLLVNNSVTPELAGQVNGLAMTTTAIGRSMAPLLAGSLFSWSVTYGPKLGPPFDVSFTFFILGFFYIISCLQCLIFIRPSLDKQKK